MNEPGVTLEDVRADCSAVNQLFADRWGTGPSSYVFPRNQANHVDALRESGINQWRSNPDTWYWDTAQPTTVVTRCLRAADGFSPWPHRGVRVAKGEQRASHFVRLALPQAAWVLHRKRIVRDAAHLDDGEVLHLWWHPHNLGAQPVETAARLDHLLSELGGCLRRQGSARWPKLPYLPEARPRLPKRRHDRRQGPPSRRRGAPRVPRGDRGQEGRTARRGLVHGRRRVPPGPRRHRRPHAADPPWQRSGHIGRLLACHPRLVVHTHSPSLASILRIAATGLDRARFIHTEHNVVSSYRPSTRAAHRLTARRIDELVAVSAAVLASAPPHVPRRRVLYHADLNTDRMRACLDLRFKEAGPLRLLSVGSLTIKKDHANLLRALERLDTTDLGPVWLGIVGGGPLRDSVETLARRVNQTGAGTTVELLG